MAEHQRRRKDDRFRTRLQDLEADTATGKAERVPIILRGVPSSPGVTHVTETNFSTLALSPDGKKIAVLAHGEVFAASAKDGGEAERLTPHGDGGERSGVVGGLE